MRRLYTLLLVLALPAASLVVAWRGLRDRRYWQGWRERFGCGPALHGEARAVWVHAVSVGEVQAASSLLQAMRAAWPAVPLVVTSATPAGRERARALHSAGAARYAPYDLPWCLRGALRRLRPALLVILEAEIWPNLLDECARAGVPVLFASARLSARSAARWRRVGALLQPAFHTATTVAAQTPADAERFESLGVPRRRVQTCGNIKFDRAAAPAIVAAGAALRERYAPDRALWVAGSTHAGEEEAALQAHAALRRVHPDALLVLAPRHQPRFEAVATLLERSGLSWQRHNGSAPHANSPGASAAPPVPSAPAVLLLDTIGELETFYAAADVAFVGGSLVPVGGHNLLEPASLAVATLAGPYQDNAPDIAQQLSANAGLVVVRDGRELGRALIEVLADPAARARLGAAAQATVRANRGALARTMALAAGLIGASSPGSEGQASPLTAPALPGTPGMPGVPSSPEAS